MPAFPTALKAKLASLLEAKRPKDACKSDGLLLVEQLSAVILRGLRTCDLPFFFF